LADEEVPELACEAARSRRMVRERRQQIDAVLHPRSRRTRGNDTGTAVDLVREGLCGRVVLSRVIDEFLIRRRIISTQRAWHAPEVPPGGHMRLGLHGASAGVAKPPREELQDDGADVLSRPNLGLRPGIEEALPLVVLLHV